jgi:pimeloyl-ACP methyl ester carboxylesterase
MARARANGIEIEHETFGERSAAPLLLIMGLGAQLIHWDEEFCRRLAGRGFFVVRYDNRDAGLSTKFDSAPVPDLMQAAAAFFAGQAAPSAYTLDDMADDAAGLLEALATGPAHVVGASMGGMIAQALAIRHPRRVLTLTSIMSNAGGASAPPKAEVSAILLGTPPAERAANIEYSLQASRALAGGGFPFDEAAMRDLAERAYDRSYYPQGTARQLAAIIASGSRKEALSRLRLPTLVIHGTADPLVPLEGGLETHAAVPGAELMAIEGMGHELPRAVWPRIIDAVCRLAERAAAPA